MCVPNVATNSSPAAPSLSTRPRGPPSQRPSMRTASPNMWNGPMLLRSPAGSVAMDWVTSF
ncbi:unnamed protein product [Staurois parvus]|uniref:Uncharacterized protein n=1 Tax=Staurois parvus TaxID=386267 RepID=A0ABN9CNW7_9NEOB|nr:unnamed protein product [Staurois parvus]